MERADRHRISLDVSWGRHEESNARMVHVYRCPLVFRGSVSVSTGEEFSGLPRHRSARRNQLPEAGAPREQVGHVAEAYRVFQKNLINKE